MDYQRLVSDQDRSVNFITPYGDGMLEARYVRRNEDYFITYVSSHSGCKLACRFCHLTRTRQTSFDETDLDGFVSQISQVLGHHVKNELPAPRMNLNFMARGEPLVNRAVRTQMHDLHARVVPMTQAAGISEIRYNPSSIFPHGTEDLDLVAAFSGLPVTVYWSLYSLNPKFRKRWLPKSIDPQMVLNKLVDYQQATGEDVALHWALIAGENDSDADYEAIAEMIRTSDLHARLNLVRYNPADPGTGVEASDARYAAALRIIGETMKLPGSKIVPRVGFDVKASCGMFVSAS